MTEKMVFLTGGTGYLGCHLAYELLQRGQQVVALVRGDEEKTAVSRLQAAITQVNPAAPPSFDRLQVVVGDVTETAVSLCRKVRACTKRPFAAVWHCVATFQYQEHERPFIEAINIGGVQTMLELVQQINGAAAPPRYFHVSTAYSSGRDYQVVPEAVGMNGGDFRSLYEWSKHEGEKRVVQAQQQQRLDATILRPAIIIGSAQTQVFNDSAYYQVASAFYRIRKHLATRHGYTFDGSLDIRLVGKPQTKVNFVPVDYVVTAMLLLAEQPELVAPSLKIFNIVNEAPPTLALVHQVLCETLGIQEVRLVPPEQFEIGSASRLERALARNVAFQMPYMHEDIRFSTARLRQVLPLAVLPVPQVDRFFLTTINQAFFEMLAKRLANGRSA